MSSSGTVRRGSHQHSTSNPCHVGQHPERPPASGFPVPYRCNLAFLCHLDTSTFFGTSAHKVSPATPTFFPLHLHLPSLHQPLTKGKVASSWNRNRIVWDFFFLSFLLLHTPSHSGVKLALSAMARSRSSLALGLGLLAWIALLFAPLAFVGTVNAEVDERDEYGTVIGIVSSSCECSRDWFLAALAPPWPLRRCLTAPRIWVLPTPASV